MLFSLGKIDKMFPKSRFSKRIFGDSAGSTKLDRPHCKQFWWNRSDPNWCDFKSLADWIWNRQQFGHLSRRPKSIHQCCAKGSPTTTLKALWCICISCFFPWKQAFWYTPNFFFTCWGTWVFRAENTFGVYFFPSNLRAHLGRAVSIESQGEESSQECVCVCVWGA